MSTLLTQGFIGTIVGLVMGLTGAGGALIAIPLFINLLGMPLKEATFLSLIAVIFGTSINLTGQASKIDRKTTLNFFIFGSISNFMSLGLKKLFPEIAIAILLTLIAFFSIWSIWKKNPNEEYIQAAPQNELIKSIFTGLLIGLITTLTGLGGGVLLMPILMKFFGKTYEEALPTSLSIIFLISLTSFLLQLGSGLDVISFKEFILIGLGVLVSYFILRLSLKRISVETINSMRKWTFTLVALYSVVSVIVKSL